MKFASLFSLLPTHAAFAHCDIPCGIYEVDTIQMATHTIIRMNMLLAELEKETDSLDREFKVSRITLVKERHAELLKEQVGILWGDYFKEDMLKDFPDLHKKVWNILKLTSKARQSRDMETCHELLAAVLEFSEIFYKTKGVTPIRVKSLYPTGEDIVKYE